MPSISPLFLAVFAGVDLEEAFFSGALAGMGRFSWKM
jgi:hypothetical protein